MRRKIGDQGEEISRNRLNIALNTKWLWRFLLEEDRLWRRVIMVRWGELFDREGTGRINKQHGLGLWRKILMDWRCFKACNQWKIGRGDKIKFWKDEWIEGGCLMSHFPRIFEISQSRNMVVKEAYKENNGSQTWEVNVYRNLKDWEVQDYINLLSLLETQELNDIGDRVIWKLSQNGQFSSKSYYHYLRAKGWFRYQVPG